MTDTPREAAEALIRKAGGLYLRGRQQGLTQCVCCLGYAAESGSAIYLDLDFAPVSAYCGAEFGVEA